jgi:Glycosyl hydrolases family 28
MMQFPHSVSITDHQAIGDGKTLNTRAIQSAIDAAATPGGGGHVVVPPGTFVTGTLHLHSNLWLELRPGAVLAGSPRIGDYQELEAGFQKDLQPFHLLVIRDAENVRITGPGRIEGSGPAFWEPEPTPSGWFRELARRPSPLIVCTDCHRLIWDGIEITNSPGWTLHLKRCDDVQVRGVSIRNNLFGPNTDGIDIDGCRDVRVSDCLIVAGDDAIVLKTTPDSRSCERVTVTNCVISTHCRALKLGAHESFHDMRDIVFSNCVVDKSVSIFALLCRNGGVMENITASNIVGHAFVNPDYNLPIHIDCARTNPAALPGRIRNVLVSNFLCHTNGRILVTGEPDYPVENITLRGIQFHGRNMHDPFPGGLTAFGPQFSPATPEARAARAALVLQHVRGFVAQDVDIHWPQDMSASFHGLWASDVNGGFVNMSLISPSVDGMPPAHLEASTLRLTGMS